MNELAVRRIAHRKHGDEASIHRAKEASSQRYQHATEVQEHQRAQRREQLEARWVLPWCLHARCRIFQWQLQIMCCLPVGSRGMHLSSVVNHMVSHMMVQAGGGGAADAHLG